MKLYRLIVIESDDNGILNRQMQNSLATGEHKSSDSLTITATEWIQTIPTAKDINMVDETGVRGCITRRQLEQLNMDRSKRGFND